MITTAVGGQVYIDKICFDICLSLLGSYGPTSATNSHGIPLQRGPQMQPSIEDSSLPQSSTHDEDVEQREPRRLSLNCMGRYTHTGAVISAPDVARHDACSGHLIHAHARACSNPPMRPDWLLDAPSITAPAQHIKQRKEHWMAGAHVHHVMTPARRDSAVPGEDEGRHWEIDCSASDKQHLRGATSLVMIPWIASSEDENEGEGQVRMFERSKNAGASSGDGRPLGRVVIPGVQHHSLQQHVAISMEMGAPRRRRRHSRIRPLLSSTFSGSSSSSDKRAGPPLNINIPPPSRMPISQRAATCFTSTLSPQQKMDVLRPDRRKRCCVRVCADEEVLSVYKENTRVEYA